MTNIVVGVDGSEHSMRAIGWARELARTTATPVLHLVHAYRPPYPLYEGEALLYSERWQQARREARGLLDRAALGLEGVPYQTHLMEQSPAQAMLTVADVVGADLIAVGSRGLGRAASLVLGSVSREVVHRSRTPVLVVRDALPRPIRRVLVGADASAHSARALGFAFRWAPSAHIRAMHVVSDIPSQESLVQQMAQSVLGRTLTLTETQVEPGRITMLGAAGSEPEALASEFESGEYDLLVIGTRGLGTLGELVRGSVGDRLLRLVAGPVVIAR